MIKRVIVLALTVLMVFTFTMQGFADSFNNHNHSNLEYLTNLEVEFKQTREGLVEEGSVEIDGTEITFRKIDKKDGTIEIFTVENGEEYRIIIDRNKNEMRVNEKILNLEEIMNISSSFVEEETEESIEILSTNWVYQTAWNGDTFIDGMISGSLSIIAAGIIASMPGGVAITFSIALNLAGAWQMAFAGLNRLYYKVTKYTDFNPPSPYPYRDKYEYIYYEDSARTKFAFRDEYIDWPILP